MSLYSYEIGITQTVAGTVAIAASTAVTGSGTAFLTAFAAGYLIKIGSEWRVVASVTNDTALVVTNAFSATISGQTATAVNLVNVETLNNARTRPPRGNWKQFSKREPLGDGRVKGYGKPVVTWKWGFITQTDRDALRVYSTNASAAVYIRTRKMDSADTYAYYSGTMIWPEDEDRQTTRRIDFTLEFRFLDLLTTS